MKLYGVEIKYTFFHFPAYDMETNEFTEIKELIDLPFFDSKKQALLWLSKQQKKEALSGYALVLIEVFLPNDN